MVVVGGGLAGVAAATALARHGRKVTLLESRPRLGGRATSFADPTTGERIDNCQHVSMGCCTNFRHLCETLGTADMLRDEPELYFIAHDGRMSRFAAAKLPAPFHLVPALARIPYLSWPDKLRIGIALRKLARDGGLDGGRQSFATWLEDHRQTPAAIERFWKVVLVSALSESLDRISVVHARKVFVDGFLANRRGWVVQVPRVPLEDLYGERLDSWFARHDVACRCQSPVRQLIAAEGRITHVELRSGERVAGDEFVLAVPHFAVAGLVPETIRQHPRVAALSSLATAPIAGVHLWFDRPITTLPHAVLVDRLSQWVFHRPDVGRSALADETADETETGPATTDAATSGERHYYQVVVSAARELEALPREQAIAAVVADLQVVWPEARAARLLHSRLVIERRAVISMLPGVDALRPPQQSPIGNLQFAGDWTRTGWPSTMEGAVRSGYLAAENILTRVGRPTRLLRPDLPPARLAKLFMGL